VLAFEAKRSPWLAGFSQWVCKALAGTIRMGHGLWVHCENRECLHRARIDLEAIAAHYGAELSVAEFINRSVCSECGTRWPNISISLEPGGTRGAKMGYTGNIRSIGALPVLSPSGLQ